MLSIFQALLNDPGFISEVNPIVKVYHPNEKILTQGVIYCRIYLINEGSVRVMLGASQAKSETHIHPSIAELNSNDVFGELGLFDEMPANADIIALTKTTITEIKTDALRKYFDNNPQIGYKFLVTMFQVLVKRLRHADNAIVNLYQWGLQASKIDKDLE